MKKLAFDVHTYAPELNKVYYRGNDISKLFSDDFRKSLNKDYRNNLHIVRTVSVFTQAKFRTYAEIVYHIPEHYGIENRRTYGGYYEGGFASLRDFIAKMDRRHNLSGTTRTVRLFTKYS